MLRFSLFMAFLLACTPSWAGDALRLDFSDLVKPTSQTYYRIFGYNHSQEPSIVIVRMDDQANAPYHNRVNEERTVLPGPFELWIQPAALQTPKRRFLKLDRIRQLKVFSPDNVKFEAIQKKQIQKHRFAYDFGDENSPVFMGFQKLTPKSPFIKTGNPKPFIRKGTDSLIRDGIKGITRLEVPLPNGEWLVHLWTEDIGEWETLPALYERRIRINGQTVQMLRQSHSEWIASRYMIGKYDQGNTPWEGFGQRRGGLLQFTSKVTNGTLRIDLAGANAQATTVTGLLIEKLGQDDFAEVQSDRRAWFEKRWPYISKDDDRFDHQKRIVTFGGETLFIPYSGPAITIPNPFSGEFFAGKEAFHRSAPNSGLLVKAKKRLTPQTIKMENDYLRLNILKSSPAGVYKIGELELSVLKGRFPEINKSIGIYLEEPPHLRDPNEINMQVWCDLDYLGQLGLTAVAPPFSKDVVADYNRAKSMGFQDVLAYTPVKRHLGEVKDALKAGEINDLILSIADEPSNPGQAQAIQEFSAQLQNATPFAKRAGHFNNPKDKKHLKHMDYVLINSGFGTNLNDILRLKKQKKTVWFYNMEVPRLASGFYLWRTGVEGYLQWHGRMPTADPYDPTDGREDDVQLLYPAENICSQEQEIDIRLIQMVNGLSDLRWLLWLDGTAKSNREARYLKRKILKQIPERWKEAQLKKAEHWQNLKTQIQELALRLQN